MTRKTETIANLDVDIKRWKTKLKRAFNKVDELEKRRGRLVLKIAEANLMHEINQQVAKEPEIFHPDDPRHHKNKALKTEKVVVFEPEPVRPRAHADLADLGATLGTAIREAAEDAGIPEFLRRGVAAQKAADAVIADQIREENAAAKTAKARGRIAKMKAKKSGETKKMPLTGKAARDLINNG